MADAKTANLDNQGTGDSGASGPICKPLSRGWRSVTGREFLGLDLRPQGGPEKREPSEEALKRIEAQNERMIALLEEIRGLANPDTQAATRMAIREADRRAGKQIQKTPW